MSPHVECKDCKSEISSGAKSCPKCGSPVKKKTALWKKIGIGWMVLVIISHIAKRDGESSAQSGSFNRSATAAGGDLSIPAAESRFLEIVKKARREARAAQNDMIRGGILADRSGELKRLAFEVKDWIGKVAEVDSNSDGKGVLSIEVETGVSVKTWNNALSDLGDNTLLDPGSPVFAAASQLKRGQWVKFSGTFFPDDRTGFKEQSLSLRGKLEEPEFVFRFTSVVPE